MTTFISAQQLLAISTNGIGFSEQLDNCLSQFPPSAYKPTPTTNFFDALRQMQDVFSQSNRSLVLRQSSPYRFVLESAKWPDRMCSLLERVGGEEFNVTAHESDVR